MYRKPGRKPLPRLYNSTEFLHCQAILKTLTHFLLKSFQIFYLLANKSQSGISIHHLRRHNPVGIPLLPGAFLQNTVQSIHQQQSAYLRQIG